MKIEKYHRHVYNSGQTLTIERDDNHYNITIEDEGYCGNSNSKISICGLDSETFNKIKDLFDTICKE